MQNRVSAAFRAGGVGCDDSDVISFCKLPTVLAAAALLLFPLLLAGKLAGACARPDRVQQEIRASIRARGMCNSEDSRRRI